MKELGKIIQERLEIKNMTQNEIGTQLGLTQKAISKYVTGKSQPSLDVLSKICNILEIDITSVLEIESANSSKYIIDTKDEYELIAFYRKISTKNKAILIEIIHSLDKTMD